MKIYSEITKEFYDNVEDCESAEKKYQAEKEALAVKEAEKEALAKNEKKELSKAIEDADKELTLANELYEKARSKAAEILDKSNKEVSKILDEAGSAVKSAEEKKLAAIIAFNKKYGKYTRTITGEKAAEEFNKAVKRVDDLFKSAFNHFWF